MPPNYPLGSVLVLSAMSPPHVMYPTTTGKAMCSVRKMTKLPSFLTQQRVSRVCPTELSEMVDDRGIRLKPK